MSLLNVQADDTYRRLVDEVLDEVRPQIEARDPGMCYRAGWIFVSSPGAVTPFHIDHEHNVILQILGTKRLYTWDPFDREVVSERAQELFHDQHSREQVIWRDDLKKRARVFELEPGMGAYYTDSTRRRELLYRGNARLRRLGLSPRPVGTWPARDRALAAALGGFTTAKSALRRAMGKSVRDSGVSYAPA